MHDTQSTQSNQMFLQINVFAKQTEQSTHIYTLHENKHSHTPNSFYFCISFQDLPRNEEIQTTEKKYDFTFRRKRKEGVSVSLYVNMCFVKENFQLRDRYTQIVCANEMLLRSE